MKVNTNQKTNCYTQGQQGIASILLTVCLLVSVSPEGALAAPKGEGATKPETTTSLPGQLASRSSRPIVEKIESSCTTNGPGCSVSQYAQGTLTTVDARTPLLSQPAEDPGRSLRQYAQGSCATADDKTLHLLHQAAKEQDPTLRQASAYALAKLATTNDRTLQLLDQAAKDQDEDVREIALAALKTLEPAPSTPHTDKKRVLQKFFEQAAETNDVPRLSKLILENTDEVGELCESLAVDLLMTILPQTADTLLTWGVEHNKYELVKLIIEHGRQHITNKLGYSLGQEVTKRAAEKGYRKLFLLLIEEGVDVDTRHITAFMSAIIGGYYKLAQVMIHLGEYRLEHRSNKGETAQDYLNEKKCWLRGSEEKTLLKQAEALESLLHKKIKAMKQNKPKEEQQASSKKEQ